MTELSDQQHNTLPDPSVDIGGLRGPGGVFHPIEYSLSSPLTERDPNEPYRIFAIRYTDDAETKGDGALFEIDPNGAMPVMHITEESYHAHRQVVEGSGTVLAVLPSGEVKQFEVDADSGSSLEQGAGWIDCWIAGPNGMKIVDSSQPGFQLSFEKSVQIDDPSLPSEYWDRYHQLTAESNRPL